MKLLEVKCTCGLFTFRRQMQQAKKNFFPTGDRTVRCFANPTLLHVALKSGLHRKCAIHLSNFLTDHFSNSLPEKTTKDIRMKFSQCPFKNILYRLPLSNRGTYLQIIHERRKAIFTFYGTCIACVNNITFKIEYFT